MPEQFLRLIDIAATFQLLRREAVTQLVRRDFLAEVDLLRDLLDYILHSCDTHRSRRASASTSRPDADLRSCVRKAAVEIW